MSAETPKDFMQELDRENRETMEDYLEKIRREAYRYCEEVTVTNVASLNHLPAPAWKAACR